MSAIGSGFQRITDLLLRTGADITIQTKDGNTALKEAIRHRPNWREYTELIKYFLNYGVAVNVIDPNGNNELYRVNDVKIATLLLKAEVDPNVHDIMGFTPLAYAIKHGNILLIKVLLKYGADVNIKLEGNDSLFHINTNNEMVDILLEAGLDINTENVKVICFI